LYMASNGLREAVLDLQSRLNPPNGFLSGLFQIKYTKAPDSNDYYNKISPRISEWYGQRVFSVKWLVTGCGCPFQIGSSVKILYAYPQANPRLMALADSSDNILFVSAGSEKMGTMSDTVMKELNENDVKLKWFDDDKLLQLVTRVGTYCNFIQIEPLKLEP
jgi:hypothetical protein